MGFRLRKVPWVVVKKREPNEGLNAYAHLTNDHFPVEVDGTPGIPDPVRYGSTPSRAATMPIAFFIHPYDWTMDRRSNKVAYASPLANAFAVRDTGPAGQLGYGNPQRVNIRDKGTVPYGSLYEINPGG